jgi:integrase
MGLPNLALRGTTYWWRRRITIGGHRIPLALSMRTGIFREARLRAGLLSAAVERLRMAYGVRGSSIDPSTLKKIFSDALRWQLERIMRDQTATPEESAVHASINAAYAELWRIMARPDPNWRKEDEERLNVAGWSQEAIEGVRHLWEQHQGGRLVSQSQLKAYENRFGFYPTPSNLDKVKRVILSAREAACRQATLRLEKQDTDTSEWVADALADNAPLAFEEVARAAPAAEPAVPVTSPAEQASPAAAAPTAPAVSHPSVPPLPTEGQEPSQPGKPKKLLREAAKECIEAHEEAVAWGPDSVQQVETAIRLFDFACGGDVAIEDLDQGHVTAFHNLCKKMPNRWGKTRDEMDRGIIASVEYGEALKSKGEAHRLGFSTPTLDKHVTWIEAVLRYADDDGADKGHRPNTPLRFKTGRSAIGRKSHAKLLRARDRRANWTKVEVARLLEAPIWWGCQNLDRRFNTGDQIYHDAWYWLPLMYILYGGRSSELAALPLEDVFENAEIPYFKVDYTDLRGLKNVQSIRKLPVHPELIRLGFVRYVKEMRVLRHALLFPEMHSANSQSFASTFYRSVFKPWREWAFPEGTEWRHQARGAVKDKDVHSFRGVVGSMMKGKVQDSVRFDILGHEGENTTMRVYDEEAELEEKLEALRLVSSLTEHIQQHNLRLRPVDRQRFGARRGAPPKTPR